MNNIVIDTGLKEYSFNDKVTVHFNPADTGFFSKVFTAFSDLDAKQTEYAEQIDKTKEDGAKIIEVIQKADEEMRAILDNLFDVPVSDALFDHCHLTARASNGLPVWAVLLMSVIDECDSELTDMNKKASANVKKYVDKYSKKYHR